MVNKPKFTITCGETGLSVGETIVIYRDHPRYKRLWSTIIGSARVNVIESTTATTIDVGVRRMTWAEWWANLKMLSRWEP